MAEVNGQSPAPASGAPGEEVPSDFDPHPKYGPCDGFHNGACSVCAEIIFRGLNENHDLRTRLAAAERAGVALREALTFYATQANWFSPSEGFALQYDPEPSPVARDSGAKARAALTPTAPSPEERANDQ